MPTTKPHFPATINTAKKRASNSRKKAQKTEDLHCSGRHPSSITLQYSFGGSNLASGNMWTARIETLVDGRGLKFAIDQDASPIAYDEVLRRWQIDSDFRTRFIGWLADSPFSACRWETPPITTATANRPFEFVLLDSPGLANNPDAGAFADHFRAGAQRAVVEFPNLGRDAIMVVPCPVGPHSAYGHLGAFVRLAPEAQRHALWELVGTAMQRRLGERPVWLSTAGAGVSWLHVRLDDRPKYYGYAPYRNLNA